MKTPPLRVTPPLHCDASPPASPMPERRAFLFSLSAFALAGCGGGMLAPTAQAAPMSADRRQTGARVGGAPFAHPGIMHSESDFTRIRQNLALAPWSGGWRLLKANVNVNRGMAPLATIYRGQDVTQNFGRLVKDCMDMYAMALYWKITGDVAYASKATQMLNAWTATVTSLQGVDRALLTLLLLATGRRRPGTTRGASGGAAGRHPLSIGRRHSRPHPLDERAQGVPRASPDAATAAPGASEHRASRAAA